MVLKEGTNMKGSFLKILLVISDVLFVAVIGYVYVGPAALDLAGLISFYQPLIDLPLSYVAFVTATVADFTAIDFTSLTTLAVLGGSALGLILGVIALIVGFKKKRPILGLSAFVSVVALFLLGVSLALPNADEVRFYELILNNSTQLNLTIVELGLLLAPLLFGFLSLFIVFIMVLVAKPRGIKQPKVAKIKPSKPVKVADLPLNNANSIPTTPIVAAPVAAPVAEDNLSELVKMVMQEEINLMRTTQSAYPNQNFGGTNGNAFNNAVDVNMIRRIVTEEVAKIQTVSRSEVQSLIAQEVTLLKSKLKIK